ncbi:MAG TPA: sigma-70 family RNA polymerase sigma factor, partial [Planctomycetota bacterium]|nr:sigma-70 family RNA polymerase sigma factor [Planctomycetota bacterium]
MTALPFRFDDLLAHGAQVDALARQLCRDEHAAADAVQDTWMAALRHGRPRGQAPGFLAAVLRNVVRMRGRTERRAELRHSVVAARERLAESAADAAARVELQRFVAGAVLALPEPQRSLVLLHYFEGRPVAALARDHRLTADAVRAHLRRARDTLRQRLRTHEGPARGAFAALLLPQPPLLPWLAGATLVIGMKTQWFVAAAVAAVVVAFTCWQLSEPGPELRGSPSAFARSAPATAATAPAAGVGPVAESTVRTAVDERAGAAADRLVRCQLVGLLATAPWTTPLEVHVEHWSQPGSVRKQPVFLQPDAHGAFAIEVPPGVGQGFGAAISANDPNYADFEVVANFVLSRHATAPYELRVQPVSRIVGTVVDFRGTPVRDALVAAFAWVDGRPRGPHTDATTGHEGQFRIKVPMEAELFLVAIACTEAPPAGLVRDDLLSATARVQARFGAATAAGTLTLPQPAMITGELRDPQGRPVAGEFVYWWPRDSELDLEIDMRTQLVGRQWHELITAPWA